MAAAEITQAYTVGSGGMWYFCVGVEADDWATWDAESSQPWLG